MRRYLALSITLVLSMFFSIQIYGTTIYVDHSAPAGGDGLTWATSFQTLADASSVADANDQIWVSKGDYTILHQVSFYESISIYGGFIGNETDITQRNLDLNTTKLICNDLNLILINIFINEGLNTVIDGISFEGSAYQFVHFSYPELESNNANFFITNCKFKGQAVEPFIDVTAFYFEMTNCLFRNCLVINSNSNRENLIFTLAAENHISNNIFYENQVQATIWVSTSEKLHFFNNIVSDFATYFIYINSSYISSLTDLSIKNNHLLDTMIVMGYESITDTLNYYSLYGENNTVWLYPHNNFVSTSTDDFRHDPCSAGINAGDNSLAIGAVDIKNENRIENETIDLGCYEYKVDDYIIYVDKDANGTNDGSSWTNAYSSITTATQNAPCHSEIWISEGIYTFNPTETITPKGYVKLYGGFNGTQGLKSQRDWGLYTTTISGEQGDPNDSTDNRATLISYTIAGNSYVVLDGFKFINSYANDGTSPVINANYTYVELANCKFKNNDNRIATFIRSPIIKNCIFSDNDPSSILFSVIGTNTIGDYTALNIDHCTFANNTATALIPTSDIDKVEIRNSIFYKNGETYIGDSFVDSTIIVNNNFDSVYIYSLEYVDTSNIFRFDPMFVNETNQNYKLMSCSPMVDLGIANGLTAEYDVSREDRISNGITDLGANEFQYPTINKIYVDHTATGNDDGGSWSNAFVDLQDAIDDAIQGDQIWVAQGTYTPFDPNNPSQTDRYVPGCGVSLYGGFIGNETLLEERVLGPYPTILSGRDISGNTYSYHVLRLKDFTADAVLDGFTIEGGNASNAVVTRGGGLWLTNVVGTVNNCIIANNAGLDGGGMYIEDSPKANIRNCTFEFNEAFDKGAAVYVKNSTLLSRNNTFASNINLSGATGGLFLFKSEANIKNNLFRNNVGLEGGAIAVGLESYAKINYSTFYSNAAVLADEGGAIKVNASANCDIYNSILYNNIANNTTDNFAGEEDSIYIENSIIEGGWTGTGMSIIDENPQFENTLSADFTPKACSPAIDLGNDFELPNNDLYAKQREVGNGPDLGAIEQKNPYYNDTDAGEDKIVCNGIDFTLSYTVPQNDSIFTTWDGSESNSGIMFNLRFNETVTLQKVSFHKECQNFASNKIYYKTGSYSGSETTMGDWTEIHSSTTSVVATCTLGDTVIASVTPTLFESGKTYSLYISSAAGVNSNLIYASNDPTKGFGDTLISNELVTLLHGRGTRDQIFNAPTPFSRIFEGGLHVTRFDSIEWKYNNVIVGSSPEYTEVGGRPVGYHDYEATIFKNGCGFSDSLQVISYETTVNDECIDALIIDVTDIDPESLSNQLLANNFCGSASGISSSCNNNIGRDVWFKFEGTKSSRLNIEVTPTYSIGNFFNIGLTLYEGNCNNLTEIECVDDFGSFEKETLVLSNLNPNKMYYLNVDGLGQQRGLFNIVWTDPCSGQYEDLNPLPDFIGSCAGQNIILSPNIINEDTILTSEIVPKEVFGSYFDVTTNTPIKVKRIGSSFKNISGIYSFFLYYRNGSSLTAPNDMSAWTYAGVYLHSDPDSVISEIPINIDQIIAAGDTLGIFLYCNGTNTNIRVNEFGNAANWGSPANGNGNTLVLKGRTSNGPAFSGPLGIAATWPIGYVSYDKVDTVAWKRNNTFVSNDLELLIPNPINNDVYSFAINDYLGCQLRDTTIIKLESKIVKNTNDNGWRSLRSVLNCANGGDTLTFDPTLLGQTIELDSEITVKTRPGPNSNIYLQGFNSSNPVIISAGYNSRIFHVKPGTNDTHFHINSLLLKKGIAKNGGAIWSNADMTINHCFFSYNYGVSSHDIYNKGSLILKNVDFSIPLKRLASTPQILNEGLLVIKGAINLDK